MTVEGLVGFQTGFTVALALVIIVIIYFKIRERLAIIEYKLGIREDKRRKKPKKEKEPKEPKLKDAF